MQQNYISPQYQYQQPQYQQQYPPPYQYQHQYPQQYMEQNPGVHNPNSYEQNSIYKHDQSDYYSQEYNSQYYNNDYYNYYYDQNSANIGTSNNNSNQNNSSNDNQSAPSNYNKDENINTFQENYINPNSQTRYATSNTSYNIGPSPYGSFGDGFESYGYKLDSNNSFAHDPNTMGHKYNPGSCSSFNSFTEFEMNRNYQNPSNTPMALNRK